LDDQKPEAQSPLLPQPNCRYVGETILDRPAPAGPPIGFRFISQLPRSVGPGPDQWNCPVIWRYMFYNK
jgi:hypothetical protein